MRVTLKRNSFERWVVADDTGRYGWSGSRWVRMSSLGVPTGEAQVSNFTTREEAGEYARQAGFEVAP